MNVSDSNSATGPIFVAPVGNQTAAIGREVVFSCSVRNISIRKYKVMMAGNGERKHEWAMRIKFARIWWRVDGTYPVMGFQLRRPVAFGIPKSRFYDRLILPLVSRTGNSGLVVYGWIPSTLESSN